MKCRIKKYLAGLLVIMTGIEVFAQKKPDGTAPQFLYPEFIKGEIRLKSGRSQFALLNYNTVSEKVVFMQNDKILDLVNTGNIDTIYISRSKFIPAKDFYYELLIKDRLTLFVEHKGKLLQPGKPGAYGTTSQTSSSTSVGSMEFETGFYNLKLPQDYDVRLERVFWIKKDTAIYSFNNERQFLKLFPESSEDLKKYIRQDKIKFDRITDVTRLVTWTNKAY